MRYNTFQKIFSKLRLSRREAREKDRLPTCPPQGKGVYHMKFLESIGKAVGDAASYLGEKSRKTAYLNRIRTVIRCEEKAAEKEYLALGRYYYNNLRDRNNPATEVHCAELEAIEARLEKALNQLEQFYQADNSVIDAALAPEEEREEISLDDVACFDHDPVSEPAADDGEEKPEAPAASNENDDLPFEG